MLLLNRYRLMKNSCTVSTGRYGLIVFQSANIGVDKYLSPVSGRRTTIVFPSFSGRLASSMAAHAAAPEEIPTSMPSLRPISFPVLKESSFVTGITSSYIEVFNTSGTNPAPIPVFCVNRQFRLKAPQRRLVRQRRFGYSVFLNFRYSPTPVTVPPVPTPATK